MINYNKKTLKYKGDFEKVVSQSNNRRSIILAYLLFGIVAILTIAVYVKQLPFFTEVLPGSVIICAIALIRIQELKSIK
ncbi:MAG: hypothetical protein AB8B72_03855 [Crocinitomicaceae bacterium]